MPPIPPELGIPPEPEALSGEGMKTSPAQPRRRHTGSDGRHAAGGMQKIQA